MPIKRKMPFLLPKLTHDLPKEIAKNANKVSKRETCFTHNLPKNAPKCTSVILYLFI